MKRIMNIFEAIDRVEGQKESTKQEYIESVQSLIERNEADGKLFASLPLFYTVLAEAMIRDGYCHSVE